MFPKIVVPQNGWFIRENPIKMDDLGGKPIIFGNPYKVPRRRRAKKRRLSYHLKVSYHLLWDLTSEVQWVAGWIRRFK